MEPNTSQGQLELLIATRNIGKLGEFRDLFRHLPIALLDLRSFPDIPEIDETGATFQENARIKAIGYARESGLYAIADDSGLEIVALGGAPGVHSARFCGLKAGYDVKISRLLAEMETSKHDARDARFVSHIVLAHPAGNLIFEAEGVCEGMIADRPRGSNGFGYDPIFVPAGYAKTFGELDDEVKLRISHRARAVAKIIRFLRDFA